MKISSVSVGSKLVRGPLKVIATQPVVLEHYSSENSLPVAKVIAGVSAAGISHQAWAGFQATNTTGADEMVKLLVKNGLAPQHAPAVARKAMDIIQAEPTKMLLIAVSAGGGVWAAVEAGKSLFGLRISRLVQVLLAALVAAAAAAAYHYLRANGVVA